MLRYLVLLSLVMFCHHSMGANFESALDSAKHGNSEAKRVVGLSLYYGRFIADGTKIERNFEEALSWLGKAAEDGDTYALFHLAGVYFEGNLDASVAVDKKKAFDLYLKAARRGHRKSQKNIAILLSNGDGVVRDLYEAYAWASLSAFNGEKDAEGLLRRLVKRIDFMEKADLRAQEIFMKFGNRSTPDN